MNTMISDNHVIHSSIHMKFTFSGLLAEFDSILELYNRKSDALYRASALQGELIARLGNQVAVP